ncbi:MAG: class I SAM-dependent methyltransferase [Planctomycetota bacterium]|nr:MAG: class I SAM-dependent methyltransferase [Planctomycetota bacterium]
MSTSYERTRKRFAGERAAQRYDDRLLGSAKDRRERRAIAALLGALPSGARVLDLPCGTGRLTGWLAEQGWRVVAADASAAMVVRAQTRLAGTDGVAFSVHDALRTGFRSGSFDAVVCNRLLHHLIEPEARTALVAELLRVSAGPLVVSYFDRRSLHARWVALRDRLRGKRRRDRLAIPRARLRREIEAAGGRLVAIVPTRRWVSQQHYARIERR